MIPSYSKLQYVPVALSVFLFAIFSHFYFGQIGDDSYIYFRYVERALEGKWWSWSDHIAPVEGYSSPLWYLLLITVGKLGFAIEIAARIIGLVFAALTLLGAWKLSRLLNASVMVSGVACLLLIMNEGFHYWASSGLETSLYSAIFVWATIGIVQEKNWMLPVALIGIARPEGPILLLAVLLAIFIVKRDRLPIQSLLLVLIPTLLWFVLRLSIYEVPLPNTFYAKATGEPLRQLVLGLIYGLPVLLPLLVLWSLWFSKKDEAQMVVLGMMSMLLGIIVLGGGDWMIHFRLLVPLLALLVAAVAAQWASSHIPGRSSLILSLGLVIYLSVPLAFWSSAMTGGNLDVRFYQEGFFTFRSQEVANDLRQAFPGKRLVAVNHAGALPWALPEYDFIDMAGLNDAHIARAKGQMHAKFDVGYVLDLQPDLIVLNSRVEPGKDGVWYHKGYWAGEDALVDHSGFKKYQPLEKYYRWDWEIPFPYSLLFPDKRDGGWILVYARKG